MSASEFRPHYSVTIHNLLEELLLFHYLYIAFWKVAVLNRDPTILQLKLQNNTHIRNECSLLSNVCDFSG